MPVSYILYFFLVLFGLRWNSLYIYILFALMSMPILIRKKYNWSTKLLIVGIYSIILPNNYISEVIFVFSFFIKLLEEGVRIRKTKYTGILVVFILNALFSTIVNWVPMPNIVFSIISFLPLIIFLCLINSDNQVIDSDYTEHIDKVLYIEAMSIPINYILYSRIYGDDWSSGTFKGNGEQSQLFVIAAFLAIYYINNYIYNHKDRKTFVKTILAFAIALSTNCWMLLIALIAGSALAYITTLNYKKIIIALVIIMLLPMGINTTLKILPEKIMVTVNRIVSDNIYFNYRFYKAVVYKKTFLEIPREDLKFALIGSGVGNYDSRAALICTGEYVDFYNSLFKPSVGKYTQKYIFEAVRLAHNNGGSDYGSVLARPYSSVLALMGECGYIGIGLFIILIIVLLKRRGPTTKNLVLIWLSFCFVENYFEYSKVLLMLYVCIISVERISKKVETNESEIEKNDKRHEVNSI